MHRTIIMQQKIIIVQLNFHIFFLSHRINNNCILKIVSKPVRHTVTCPIFGFNSAK